MGDRGKVVARAASVLVVAGGLLSVVAATPSYAAGGLPSQCVQVARGTTVQLDSSVPLEDIDVRVQLGFREVRSPLYLINGLEFQDGPRWLLADQFNRFGGVAGVTFDNQAERSYDDPPSGTEIRVRPRDPLPQNWYGSDYTFRVEEGFSGPSYDIEVTVRWSDCDEDNDFSGDRTRDNCVGLHNPDQADLDRDGRGDPCDPDDDNDGVADTSDSCPTVANADQADWDGDRIGNACDASPGVAPPPTTTPVPPATGPGCTSGCAYARTVGLRHRAARHRFTGTVDSVAAGCRAGVEVTLWRKRSGEDRKLVVMTTRDTGTFRTRAPRRAGRYYATVGSPDQPLCGPATSRVVRVRR